MGVVGAELRVKGGGALPPVAGRVVVGVCDVAGVGVRALLGMMPATPGAECTHACELELHGVGDRGVEEEGGNGSDAGAVFTAGGDPDLSEDTPRIAMINLPGLTLIAVNTSICVNDEAPFAAAVHALVTDAECSSVVLVGALRLNVKGEGKIFHTTMHGCQPLRGGGSDEGFEFLEGGTAVNDGVIAALMLAMRASATPTACLFTHGYRVPKLGGDAAAEAAAAADRLGAAAAAALGCTYRSKAGDNTLS